MKLSTLLAEIERSHGPVTGVDLAHRLGLSPAEVASMLVALRAAGRIGPEQRGDFGPVGCATAGTCSMSCPGPDKCSMTVDLNVTGLELRSPSTNRFGAVGAR